MRGRWLIGAGIVAPILYALTVVIGGAFTPGYGHYSDTVSELVGIGAPNKALIDPILMVASLLGVAYGIEAFRLWKRLSMLLGAAGLGVLLVGIVSFAILWFPVDGSPAPRSPIEATHIALTGVVLLAMVGTVALFSIGLRRMSGWPRLGGYSVLTTLVILVAGILTAIGEPNDWPSLGLVERFAIGPYLLWMLVTALTISRSISRPTPRA